MPKKRKKNLENDSFLRISHCLTVSNTHNAKQNVAGSFIKANSCGVETAP